MSVQGKTLSIGGPSFLSAIDIFSYRKWTLKFRCGNCKSEPTVQHDEINNYHRCPVCKEINILDKAKY